MQATATTATIIALFQVTGTFFSGTVTWTSKKQPVAVLGSCESEKIALQYHTQANEPNIGLICRAS